MMRAAYRQSGDQRGRCLSLSAWRPMSEKPRYRAVHLDRVERRSVLRGMVTCRPAR